MKLSNLQRPALYPGNWQHAKADNLDTQGAAIYGKNKRGMRVTLGWANDLSSADTRAMMTHAQAFAALPTLCVGMEKLARILERPADNQKLMQIAGPAREALNILRSMMQAVGYMETPTPVLYEHQGEPTHTATLPQ